MNRRLQLLAAALDELPVNVSVLDSDGVIQQTNNSWQAFAERNDISESADTVGVDYLDVCEHAGTESALAVKRGLSELLAGHREFFEYRYPCHSPIKQRWFLLQAVPFVSDNEQFVVVAHIDVSAQVVTERRLRAERDSLASLNDLNSAIREITHTAIGESTRPEIEQAVCTELVETGHYTCVQIGELVGRHEQFSPRASAGNCEPLTEGSTASTGLDSTDQSTDSEPTDQSTDSGSVGQMAEPESADGEPTSAPLFGETAIRQAVWTRQLQTTTTLVENPAFDWRADADQTASQQALAAVPISHTGRLYGLCVVHTDRPDAFDADERTILSQLGEVVGHALAASERREALMNDVCIQVELRLPDYIPQTTPPPGDWTAEIMHTVDGPQGGYSMFGTIEAVDRPAVEAVFEPLEGFELSVIGEQGDTRRIELHTDGVCVVPLLASHGWSTESVTLTNGDAYLTVRLPAGDSVRSLVETVSEIAPTVELLARRQQHATESVDRAQSSPVAELTDRQRTVLQTAYAAGYFQWPRDSSGEQIAETLGISPPTFHQHLRVGQQKLMDALFETEPIAA